jgi:hypothetical protein
VLEIIAGIIRESETLLAIAKNYDNTLEQIKLESETLVDLSYELDITLDQAFRDQDDW